MTAEQPPAVAAFDFDGTITRRDTLLPFLRSLLGARALVALLAPRGPALGRIAVGLGDRDGEKARLLARALAGRRLAEVEAAAAAFADRLAPSGLRPGTVERLAWHRREGHRVVVVSASPELVVRPVVARLGVDDVLATGLEVRDGTLTGRLVGANNRGPEKARRTLEWLAGTRPELWAYGDSAGDAELLALADHAVWVGRRRVSPPAPARR